MTERYRIGAFGTPCGGTNYTADVLHAAKLDVGHEHIKTAGIVCGFFLVGKHMNRIPNPSDYEFDNVVRIIRHPLRVAETLPKFVSQWNHGAAPWHVPDHADPRLIALRFWVHVHELPYFDKASHVVRIGTEHTNDDFRELINKLDRPWPETMDANAKSKQKRWAPLSWEGWNALDPEWCERGRALVNRFELERRTPSVPAKYNFSRTNLARKSNAEYNADNSDCSNDISS